MTGMKFGAKILGSCQKIAIRTLNPAKITRSWLFYLLKASKYETH